MSLLVGNRSFLDIIVKLLASLIVIFLVSPLHEYAHGYVAYKLGDTTAKDQGRLTLNPIAHLNVLGAIGILLFGFGWANPVPIDSRNFKNPKSGMAITAVAGPISNFLAAFLGCIVWNVVLLFEGSISQVFLYYVSIFFMYYVKINVGLGIFNLLPVPPLDGSRIIAYFLPDETRYKFYAYQRQLSLILIFALFLGVLDGPLYFFRRIVMNGIVWLASLPFGG